MESEGFAPLVLTAEGDIERLSILFVEKGGDDLVCRGLLELHQLAQRLAAQFLRRVAEGASPCRSAQELEYPARTHARQHDLGFRARFAWAGAQNHDQVGEQGPHG